MHHRSHDRGHLCPGRVSVLGGLHLGGLCPGGSLSRGSLSRWVSVGGRSVQGGSLSGIPPYGNERAVRIIMECILVHDANQLVSYL